MAKNTNKLLNLVISRTYKCSACGQKCYFEQKATEKFKKKCPNCGKNELYIDSATCSLSVGVNETKTIGGLADKNTRKMEKEGTLPPPKPKAKRPWWRKTDKVDLDILKNPKRFIEEGRK